MNSLVEEAKLIEYNDSKEEKTLNEYTKSYFEAKNNNVDNFAYYYLEYRNNLFDNHYDVSWFNQNILGLPANLSETNTSKCFDFAKNDKGEKDLSLVGVIKESDNFKKYLEELYINGKTSDKKHRFQPQIIAKYRKTIDLLESLSTAEDLYRYHSLRYEKLQGDKAGLESVRVNDQYRIEFKTTKVVSEIVVTVCNVIELSNHYK